MNMKLASTNVSAVAARGAQVLREAVGQIEGLENENSALREKIASFERDQLVTKIAQDMEEKGLNAGLTFAEKIAGLRAHPDLLNVQAAVEMASQGAIKIAEVSNVPGRGAVDPLTAYCLGQE